MFLLLQKLLIFFFALIKEGKHTTHITCSEDEATSCTEFWIFFFKWPLS